MNEIGFVLMAVVASGLFIAVYLAGRQRERDMRAMAIRSGFHFIGNALPRSLTLHATSFERASKIWNVIDGEPRGIRIIAFDCQVGVGKASWRRSVIAFEGDIDSSSMVTFEPEMMIESVGRWKFLFRPKAVLEFRISGLIPVEELEVRLNSIGAPASRQPLAT